MFFFYIINIYLNKMKNLFLFIISFSLFYLISSQKCNPKTNCFRENGYCLNDKCECNYGYVTFLNKNSKKIIFCNYEQIQSWIPFILELFLPSFGHFYVGNTLNGIIKLCILLIPFIVLSIGFCFALPIADAPLNLNANLEKESFYLYIPIYVSKICYYVLFYCYFFEPLIYLFGFYKDGNGVPLI